MLDLGALKAAVDARSGLFKGNMQQDAQVWCCCCAQRRRCCSPVVDTVVASIHSFLKTGVPAMAAGRAVWRDDGAPQRLSAPFAVGRRSCSGVSKCAGRLLGFERR